MYFVASRHHTEPIGILKNNVVLTLPRLGSDVRFASPAPIFRDISATYNGSLHQAAFLATGRHGQSGSMRHPSRMGKPSLPPNAWASIGAGPAAQPLSGFRALQLIGENPIGARPDLRAPGQGGHLVSAEVPINALNPPSARMMSSRTRSNNSSRKKRPGSISPVSSMSPVCSRRLIQLA